MNLTFIWRQRSDCSACLTTTGQLSPNEHRQQAEPDEHRPRWRGDHAAQCRDRFWVNLTLSIPVVASSKMGYGVAAVTSPQFPGSQWVAPVLGTVVFLYCGRPFLR